MRTSRRGFIATLAAIVAAGPAAAQRVLASEAEPLSFPPHPIIPRDDTRALLDTATHIDQHEMVMSYAGIGHVDVRIDGGDWERRPAIGDIVVTRPPFSEGPRHVAIRSTLDGISELHSQSIPPRA